MRNDLTKILWVQYSDAIMFMEKIIQIEYTFSIKAFRAFTAYSFCLRTDQAKNNKEPK